MKSVPQRYCANGEHCVEHQTLENPTRLSKYNTDEICERCKQQDKQQIKSSRGKSPATRGGNKDTQHNKKAKLSPTERRVLSARRDLVLELVLNEGAFSEAVMDVRKRRGISPDISIPQDLDSLADPPEEIRGARRGRVDGIPFYEWDGNLQEIYLRSGIVHKLRPEVPEAFGDKHEATRESSLDFWKPFIAACVLHQPPIPGLLEFAESVPVFETDEDEAKALPIATLTDPWETLGAEGYFWEHLVIPKLFERVYESTGVKFDYREEIKKLKKDESLNEEHENEHRMVSWNARDYIQIDEYTSLEEVRLAYSELRQGRGRNGKPAGHPLVDVECAILHYKYGWSHPELAEQKLWDSKDSPKLHVKNGRRILAKNEFWRSILPSK